MSPPGISRNIFVSQKTFFKYKVMNENVQKCHLLNGGLFQKFLALFFRGIYVLSNGFKMKP